MRRTSYCPFCMREIPENATRCPQCGEWLPVTPPRKRGNAAPTEMYKSESDKLDGLSPESFIADSDFPQMPPELNLASRGKPHKRVVYGKGYRFAMLGAAIILLLILVCSRSCG